MKKDFDAGGLFSFMIFGKIQQSHMINGIMMNMMMMIVKILMSMMLTMMIVFTSAV